MLRALFFAVKVGLLVAAAVWIAERPGAVEISWLGYDIHAHVGVFLLALLAGFLLLSFAFRALALPLWLKHRHGRKKHERGYRALTRGLSAVAAGDVREAEKRAAQARRFLPGDGGLPLLLEAQTARLKGDEAAAAQAFEKLLSAPDTAFLQKKLLFDLVDCPPSGAVAKQPQPNPLLDNVEGLALGGRLPGGLRQLYLLSDDNSGATQITRLYSLAVQLG